MALDNVRLHENPKLFHTDQVWSWKKEQYYDYTPFGKVKQTRTIHDKCKGLGILHDDTFYIGGFGDCSKHKVTTAITKADADKARSLG